MIPEKFKSFLIFLDSRLRRFDWCKDRNYAPKKINFIHVMGHAPTISILIIPLTILIIVGPTLDALDLNAILLLIVFISFLVVMQNKWGKGTQLFWLQNSSLLLLSILIWFWLGSKNTEHSGEVYQHILIPAFWVMLAGMFFARFLAKVLFKSYAHKFANHLKQVELFFSTKDHDFNVSWKAFARCFFTAPIYHPLQLLLLPSFALLTIADRTWMLIVASALLLIVWLYITAADVHKRLSQLIYIFKGKFFIGGQLVVSLIIIILAIGRLTENAYITTLIESDPEHVNYSILVYIIAAYVLFWFYEYWINRPLVERIIDTFRQKEDVTEVGQINYPIKQTQTRVKKDRRKMQIHGGARFAVVGELSPPEKEAEEDTNKDNQSENSSPVECWHTYTRLHLFDTIYQQLDQTSKSAYEYYQQAQIIKQRMRFYFLMLNLYLIVALIVIAGFYRSLPQKAEVSANQTPIIGAITHYDLHDHIFGDKRVQSQIASLTTPLDKNKVILLSASGGGSRAALYATSVLHGLADIKLLDNVVLTSSVSGGSASMAYFGAHRQELLSANKERWDKFSEDMAQPFIQDVLDGVVEWRLIGGVKNENSLAKAGKKYGFRMGDLLAESFERRLGLDPKLKMSHIGQQQDVGLIFNTALVAAFPRITCETVKSAINGGKVKNTERLQVWEQCLCTPDVLIADREAQCTDLRTSLGQGGRLIFTNLNDTSAFPKKGLPKAEHEYLTYVTVQDPKVKLAKAASLSANFPPVFPNSAVDLGNTTRHWVTDGGASDNRGILSLLYALKGAIKKELDSKKSLQIKSPQRDCGKPSSETMPPDIHVIIAEASATSLAYSSGSGLDAKFSAPTRFASQLMIHLSQDIETMYKKLGGCVHYQYLAMPLTLRSNGGLGTHWMLPASVKFKPPLKMALYSDTDSLSSVRLSGEQTRTLIDSLHAMQSKKTIEEDEQIVWNWICNDTFTNHQKKWKNIAKEIAGVNITQNCEE